MMIVTTVSYQVHTLHELNHNREYHLRTKVGSTHTIVSVDRSGPPARSKSIIVQFESNIANGEYDDDSTAESSDDENNIDSTNTDIHHFISRSGTSNEQQVERSFDSYTFNKKHKEQQRYDPLMGYTLENLEAFAMQQKQQQQHQTTNIGRKPIPKYTNSNLPEDVDVSMVDGILLEPNEYIQSSREYMNIDGTISNDKRRLSNDIPVADESVLPPIETDPTYISSVQGYIETMVTQPNDNNPYVVDQYIASTTTPTTNTNQNIGRQRLSVDSPNIGYRTQNERKYNTNVNNNNYDNNDLASLDEVWTAISQLQQHGTNLNQNSIYNSDVAEELHRQVFENEIGFYNQSQIFLQSLTNTTKAIEANTERRGRYYRERQTQAIALLNQQIEEFEALLQQQQQQTYDNNIINNTEEVVRCSRCQCRMSDDEINHPSAKNTEGPLCHVCNMEQLVSKSKRNDMYRTQQQARAHAALYTYRHASAGSTNSNRTISNSIAYLKNSSQPVIYQNNDAITNYTSSNNVDSAIPIQGIVQPMPTENDNNLITPPITKKSSNSWTTSASMNIERELSSTKEGIVHRPMSDSIEEFGMDDDVSDDDNDDEYVTTTYSIYPWIEVIDPDTDEIFYWNEETGEMKWEL
jgi:hypothetical protein